MNFLFLGGQRFIAAQLLQHVVHPGDRQFGMESLLMLPMCIELFA
jgi:hypothetical protein